MNGTIDLSELSRMPAAELRVLAEELMVPRAAALPEDKLAPAIRERLALIDRLGREGLLDLVIWAHRPIARSAEKLDLVREISRIQFMRYEGISHRGLEALLSLRGLRFSPQQTDRELRRILARSDGLTGWLTRARRDLAAKVIGKILAPSPRAGEYQFLPDKKQPDDSLTRQIQEQGVVGGIASKIRNAADDYIDAKLDEIERRIDQKLEEIDQRLSEWRDQEIANRLRIIKITLIGSVVVALISLVYSLIRSGVLPGT